MAGDDSGDADVSPKPTSDVPDTLTVDSGRVGLQTHLLTGDEGDQIHVDNIYAKQKQDVLSPNDGSGKPSTVNYAGPEIPTGDPLILALDQEFVYGTQYIDEIVAFYSHSISLSNWRYVLQDAGYNVVGYVNSNGTPLRQFAYHPYGKLQAVETGTGVTTNASELAMLYKGLWLDLETACPDDTSPCPLTEATLIYNRGRYLNIPLARFNSRDPNGQALLLNSALARNGQTMAAFASLSSTAQYTDGLNPYEPLGSNPITGYDPSGLLQGYHRFVADVMGSAIAGYAFSLDAGVYSLLDEGPEGTGLDQAIESIPYAVAGGFIGGAIAFATRWSFGGNVLGGAVAGGLTSVGMGDTFTSGALIGGATSTIIEGALRVLGRWRTGMVVGAGSVGAGAGEAGALRALQRRGLINRRVTVIGSRRGTLKFRNWDGFNVFVPREATWEANRQWLDDAISRDDIILLVTDPDVWRRQRPQSWFFKEIDYLLSKGYVREGNYMIPPGGAG